jgi:methylated-DNA-[protein]-cysteine S-methyltransferase
MPESAGRSWWQPTPIGDVKVMVTDEGVREITLPGDERETVDGDARDRRVSRQIDEWFRGERQCFDLTLDLRGVEGFRRTVLDTLARDVPWGETVSYGELAEMAGRPRAARAVGRVMATNPVPFIIPCHRVLAAGGRIGGYGSGRHAVDLKRALLAREGVVVP